MLDPVLSTMYTKIRAFLTSRDSSSSTEAFNTNRSEFKYYICQNGSSIPEIMGGVHIFPRYQKRLYKGGEP